MKRKMCVFVTMMLLFISGCGEEKVSSETGIENTDTFVSDTSVSDTLVTETVENIVIGTIESVLEETTRIAEEMDFTKQLSDNPIDTHFDMLVEEDDWEASNYCYATVWQEEMYHAADLLYCAADSEERKQQIWDVLYEAEKEAGENFDSIGWDGAWSVYKETALLFIGETEDYEYHFEIPGRGEYLPYGFAKNVPVYLWVVEASAGEQEQIIVQKDASGMEKTYSLKRISDDIPACFAEDWGSFFVLLTVSCGEDILHQEIIELVNRSSMQVMDVTFDGIDDVIIDSFESGNWGHMDYETRVWDEVKQTFVSVNLPNNFSVDYEKEVIFSYARGSAVHHYSYAYRFENGAYKLWRSYESDASEEDVVYKITEYNTYTGDLPEEERAFWWE